MKKNLKALCLIFALVLAIAVLVACDNSGGTHEHDWDNGTVTKEPTCSEKGERTFYCSGCEETKTEEIAKTAHTEKDVSSVTPSCTEPGLTAGKVCSVCDAVIVAQATMPKLGHDLYLGACTRCSYETYTDGLIFDTTNGGNSYAVVGYNGTSGHVVIPKTYNGLPVVSIANEAFKENEVIKSMTVPSSVTSIGEGAFYECKKLEGITIPSGVTVINAFTFYKCKSLESVTIKGNITSIGESAFAYCEDLDSISIPSSCESIGEEAFMCCYDIGTLTLPEGVAQIGANAFAWCENLSRVTIPSTLKTITAHAFFHCTNLGTVTISEGVTTIEAYAFQTCSSLTEIHIPASVNKIEAYAFAYSDLIRIVTVDEDNTTYDSRNSCNAIIETATNTLIFGCWKTTVPSDIAAIGEGAFFGNTNLSSIAIPESVVSIGKSAFSGCEGLSSITIPSGVTEIAEGLLAGCENLRTIDIKGDVTTIGAGAFKATIRLEKIIIPATVTEIGENAFYNASTNAVIYFRGTTNQWEAIDGHDEPDVDNYRRNDQIEFAYTGN